MTETTPSFDQLYSDTEIDTALFYYQKFTRKWSIRNRDWLKIGTTENQRSLFRHSNPGVRKVHEEARSVAMLVTAFSECKYRVNSRNSPRNTVLISRTRRTYAQANGLTFIRVGIANFARLLSNPFERPASAASGRN